MEEEAVPPAPIQQLRTQLATERTEAIDLADRALAGIDSVIGAANFWLTALSAGIAVLALVGGTALYFAARSMAAKVAKQRVKAYLERNENNEFIRAAIADEIKAQLKERTFVMVSPSVSEPDAEGNQDGFRRRPERGDT